MGAVLAPIDTPRLGPTFSPADRLAAAQRVLDGLQRVQSNAPQFRPVNWVTAYDVPATATSFAITGGQTLPRTGDRFTLPGSAAAYQVTGFDIASSIIHVGAGVPATAKGSLLTYPDDLNLQIVSQIFDAGIDVAFDYDPNDEENDGCSYWVLPAVAKVTVGGKSFPATWAGVESLRLALQANTGAAGAGLVFVSNFPTNWFAFAMPQRGAITMSTRLRQFKATYEEDVKTALNARDQSFVRDWLNKGGLGTNVSIPASEPLAIDVLGVDRHWRVSTTVRDGATGGRMDKIYRILATGSPKLDTLTVFANSGFKIPRWDETIEHELYHLFDAPDEYAGEGTPCKTCGGAYGVYNIPNGNCAACAGDTRHQCVMDMAKGLMCDYTASTIGWSDVLVEVTTDSKSKNNNDPMWVKLGDGLSFRLSDPVIDDRQPGARDPYALGHTRIFRSDVQMIAIGNGNPAEITTPWTIKQIRLWVQGVKIYDKDDLDAVIDKDHPFLSAPGFSGNIDSYEITIETGTRWFAGTVDWVYITLGGKQVTINEYRELISVDDPLVGGYTGFPAGSTRTTVIAADGIDIPNNRKVVLTKGPGFLFPEGLFGGDDWYPAHIKIVAHRMTGGDVVVLDQDINTWIGLASPSWVTTVQHVP